MNSAAFAAVLAGGPGTRLWPLSRKHKPKPFLKVISGDSLLEATCKRLRGVIPPSRTLVVTAAETAGLVTQGLPRLPRNNVLAEPEGRNTAASIGFAAVHARSRNPKAVLAVLPADHHIEEVDRFRLLLQSAIAWSWETDDIVTLGIPADRPETDYGYLRMGERKGSAGGIPVQGVAAFVEKPDRRKAGRYVKSGRYAWNSGIFVLTAHRALDEISRRLPALYRGLMKIDRALGSRQEGRVVKEIFPRLPAISIDYGLMEEAAAEGRVVSLPCRVGWSDVGDFNALGVLLPHSSSGAIAAKHHIGVDCEGLIVYAPEKLVATVGVRDMVVIDGGEAILVVPKKQAQDVRKVVELLKKGKLREFL